jgi:hypothetical protein
MKLCGGVSGVSGVSGNLRIDDAPEIGELVQAPVAPDRFDRDGDLRGFVF